MAVRSTLITFSFAQILKVPSNPTIEWNFQLNFLCPSKIFLPSSYFSPRDLKIKFFHFLSAKKSPKPKGIHPYFTFCNKNVVYNTFSAKGTIQTKDKENKQIIKQQLHWIQTCFKLTQSSTCPLFKCLLFKWLLQCFPTFWRSNIW